jgi:hypothetical protein
MKLMKSLAFLLLAGVVAGGSGVAQAQQLQPVKPGPILTAQPVQVLALSMIKGEIKLPAAFSASGYGNVNSLKNFNCSNLVITATSTEMKPRPPGHTGFWPPTPIWTKSANATGSWSSGKCNYSIVVPADKPFRLVGGTSGSFSCSTIEVFVTETPSSQTVPKSTTKTDDLTITKVSCVVIG